MNNGSQLSVNLWQHLSQWFDGVMIAHCRCVCRLWNERIQRVPAMLRMQRWHFTIVRNEEELARAIACSKVHDLEQQNDIWQNGFYRKCIRDGGWHGEDRSVLKNKLRGEIMFVNNYYFRSCQFDDEIAGKMNRFAFYQSGKFTVTWKLIEFPFCKHASEEFVVGGKRFHRGTCFLVHFAPKNIIKNKKHKIT